MKKQTKTILASFLASFLALAAALAGCKTDMFELRTDKPSLGDSDYALFCSPDDVQTTTGRIANDAAVVKVLWWLKANQQKDGSWSDGPCPVAATALAVLAFIEHGEGPWHVDFGGTVISACEYLMGHVSETNGMVRVLGAENDERALPIMTMALCEIYGLTRNPNVERPAELCLRRLLFDVRTGLVDGSLRERREFLKWTAIALRAGVYATRRTNIKMEGLDKLLAQVEALADGVADDGYYGSMRRYQRAMKKGANKEDVVKFIAWGKMKKKAFAKALKEEDGLMTGANGVLHRKCFLDGGISTKSSGLGRTADSALGVIELMIGGAGGRTLPLQPTSEDNENTTIPSKSDAMVDVDI